MKRLFLIICCLLFTVSCLCGCKSTSWSDTEKYKIEKIDDKYYLTLKNDTYPITNEENAKFGGVLFESMEEFEDALKNGKLSDTWLYVIDQYFRKSDEEGRRKIFDISNLQVAVTPDEVQNLKILWNGESYCFFMYPPGRPLTEPARGCTVFINIYDKENFYERYEGGYRDPVEMYDDENYHIDKVVELNDATEWYYTWKGTEYTSEYKDVRYTIEKENTKLMVQEEYLLATSKDKRNPSQSIPFRINVYGIVTETEDEKYFIATVNRPDFEPAEGWREWLSQFSIEDYKG